VANGHGGEAGDDVEHSNEQNEGQTEGPKASHQSSACRFRRGKDDMFGDSVSICCVII
jgi:hypothetical protein